jgi:hypothetical protein
VSQTVIETEYYLVDLPDLLDKRREHDAQERMTTLQLMIAANNRAMNDEHYGKLTGELLRNSGVKQETGFDRNAFEKLRAFTNSGANSVR